MTNRTKIRNERNSLRTSRTTLLLDEHRLRISSIYTSSHINIMFRSTDDNYNIRNTKWEILKHYVKINQHFGLS